MAKKRKVRLTKATHRKRLIVAVSIFESFLSGAIASCREGKVCYGIRRTEPSASYLCNQKRLSGKKRQPLTDGRAESDGAIYCVSAQGKLNCLYSRHL